MMVEVIQNDRDAVHNYHRTVAAKLMHDVKYGTNTLDPKGDDTDDLVQTFATHRIQSTAALQSELDARAATIEALQKQVAELKGRLPENVGLAKWNAKEPTQ